MIVTVDVTRHDITFSKPGSCRLCPLAQALTRAGFTHVAVDEARGFMGAAPGEADDVQFFHLPPEARRFMVAYDRLEEVAPLSFTLDLTRPQCDACHKPVPRADITAYRAEAGIHDALPACCGDCADIWAAGRKARPAPTGA